MNSWSEAEARRLQKAMEDAKRFLAAAEDHLHHIDDSYSKRRAACRRASLELTNSLVKVRLPTYVD